MGDLSVGNGRDVIVGSDLIVGTGSVCIDKVLKQLRFQSCDLMSKVPVQGDLMLHDHMSVVIDKQQVQMQSKGKHGKQLQVGCNSNS